jgi:hypothetical protein
MLEHHEAHPSHQEDPRTGLSDDMIDGITATVLILVITAGVVYWLSTIQIA